MILLNFCINVAKWLSATLDDLVRILADQQWIARKATCEQNCAGFIHIEMAKFEKLMFRKRVITGNCLGPWHWTLGVLQGFFGTVY
jgi:hypothetical protein